MLQNIHLFSDTTKNSQIFLYYLSPIPFFFVPLQPIMEVAIVKYNAGNIRSVMNALERCGVTPILTDDFEVLQRADKVIFPGQGQANTTMTYLKEHKLDKLIKDLRQPVLGICIGMQLMCRHSEEADTDCLGIFDVDVLKFRPTQKEDKVPQMGWNSIDVKCQMSNVNNPLLKDLGENPFVYYVHSYYVPLCPYTIGVTDYVQPYSGALHKDNFYAVQFHPEKSGPVGERIIRNFLEL
jgi:glutamine amidotransferase